MYRSAKGFAQFRERLKARAPMIGTFVKMPTTQVVEMLGLIGFDFVVIDLEHAPLDRAMTDLMILAARAHDMASIIRLGDATEANILSVLDCGATGIMVPHVDSVDRARDVARACRYVGGKRGYAGVTRSSGWGAAPMFQHIRSQDSQATCIAMIEDLHAIDRVKEIAEVDGIDALFIGAGDLTAALGESAGGRIASIIETVAASSREADIPLITLAATSADAIRMRQLGSSAFLVSSDHGFIRSSANAVLRDFAGILTPSA